MSGRSVQVRSVVQQWESGLAPLPARALDTVMALAAAPAPHEEAAVAQTETQRSISLSQDFDLQQTIGLGDDVLVETAQQFLTWFGSVEAQMENSQEASFLAYSSLLNQYSTECEGVLAEVTSALNHLHGLETQFNSVSASTTALHNACEQLLSDQQATTEFGDHLSQQLTYFTELERISSRLTSPTVSVTSDQFLSFLTRLDECIGFITSHMQYKDSAVYLLRYRQCQSKALSMIKVFVTNTLRNATQQVASQVQQGSDSDQSFTLYYGKFRTHAPRIKALMEDIERRAAKNGDYLSIMEDCYSCYYAQRAALLLPCVVREIEGLQKTYHSSIPSFVRAGCAYLVRVCCSEFQLYKHFFSVVDPGLHQLLYQLSEVLYDSARPLLVSCKEISVFVELCSILKVEILDDKGSEVASFISIATQMLQDAQMRFFYRAQIFIEGEIEHYPVTPNDLDYPKKLVQALTAPPPTTEAPDIPLRIYDSVKVGTWFPPLTRSLVILAKAYRSIERDGFEAITTLVIQACLTSLGKAQKQVQAFQGLLHGQLFFIKHLLVLREQIAPFEGSFSSTERSLDFTRTRAAMTDLLSKRDMIFNFTPQNALLAFLLQSSPQVTESHHDLRLDVDAHLKSTCQDFIRHISKLCTTTLGSFIAKVQALSISTRTTPSEQPFGSPEKVREVIKDADNELRTHLRNAASQLALYLANKETELVLLRTIKDNISGLYEQLRECIDSCFALEEDRAIIGCPTLEQLGALMTSICEAQTP
eukprot:m.177160 g.177160  ORF g.177160 m.177160 type:complete len:762 (-) comp53367_c0_seq2:46-2331(-)